MTGAIDPYLQWLKAFTRATDGEDATCPEYDHGSLQYQYVAEPDTRAGFAAAWCGACSRGIYISRTIVPDGQSFVTFDELEANPELIPDFTRVDLEERSA